MQEFHLFLVELLLILHDFGLFVLKVLIQCLLDKCLLMPFWIIDLNSVHILLISFFVHVGLMLDPQLCDLVLVLLIFLLLVLLDLAIHLQILEGELFDARVLNGRFLRLLILNKDFGWVLRLAEKRIHQIFGFRCVNFSLGGRRQVHAQSLFKIGISLLILRNGTCHDFFRLLLLGISTLHTSILLCHRSSHWFKPSDRSCVSALKLGANFGFPSRLW